MALNVTIRKHRWNIFHFSNALSPMGIEEFPFGLENFDEGNFPNEGIL
jgi:hypothetical protein